MFRLKVAALGGLALVAAAIVAPALIAAGPGAARPEPRWALTWDAALAEAKERNVPIFITFHQDG